MEYAKLDNDNNYEYQINTHGNIEWDSTHFCPAAALTSEEAAYFKVVPLIETEAPVFNSMTHKCQRNGGALIEGQWYYHWDVIELTPEEMQTMRITVINTKWEAIKVKRDTLSDIGGYSVLINSIPKWFHSDSKSKTQQISLRLMGPAVVNVPPWKTMDGSFVTMTQQLAGQIFASAVTMDGALFASAEVHKAALANSEDPDLYDFTAGWPLTYLSV